MTTESASVNRMGIDGSITQEIIEEEYKQLREKLKTNPFSFDKHSNKSSKLISNLKLDIEMAEL